MRVLYWATRGGRLLLLLAFLLSGCALEKPVLYNVHLDPHTTISPRAGQPNTLTRLHYSLGESGLVTIAFENEAGERYVWREQKHRTAGAYEGWFGGVVDGRVLPDGTYRVTVGVEPDDEGEHVEESVELTIVNGQTETPEILNLDVTPRTIEPNKDGIKDEATINYWLNKEMERVQVQLIGANGSRYPLPPDELHDATARGSHSHHFDGGIELGAVPPPDGLYTVMVEATDKVGATVRATDTLRLEGGGLPLAEVTRHYVDFSTETLLIGETLRFTTTVTNSGEVPIRTHGPEPGTVYDSTTNYNDLSEPIEDGAWRLGLDFEGNRVYDGRRYPYRWQLGRKGELTERNGELYLMPGQTVTITGGLRMLERPPRESPGFWVGLIHENIRFVEDFVGTTYIRIESGTGEVPSTLGAPPDEPEPGP